MTWTAFLAGLILGAGVFGLLWWRAAQEAVTHRIRAAELARELEAARGLAGAREGDDRRLRETFTALAAEAMAVHVAAARGGTEAVVKPLADALARLDTAVREMETKRAGAYASVGAQLESLGGAQAQLQHTAVTLAQALKSSTVRGRWGEVQLRRVVELAGMTAHVDFAEQVTGGDSRPDLIVRLPPGGHLVVDAKAPMNAYLDAVGQADEAARKAGMKAHADAVRERIRALGDKAYWKQFEPAPEFVVLFVPLEPALGAAFEAWPELLDFAIERKVLPATPVTLLALLKAAAWGWGQQKVTDNVRQIEALCREFYERLGPFLAHLDETGHKLNQAVESFNATAGSVSARVLPAARRLKDLGAGSEDLPEPKPIERRAGDVERIS